MKKGLLLEKIEEGITAFFFLLMCVFILLQLFSRFVLNNPFIFTEEVSRYSYVWITFIGMSLATKTSDHIRVDFFVGLLGPSAKALVSRSVTVISLLLMIYLCYLGIQFVIFSSVNYSAALQIPLAFVYISFPIGCVLTAVRLARISLKKGGE